MLYRFDPLTDPRWSEFAQSHRDGSVFHSVAWLRALAKTYGYQPEVLTTSAPGAALSNGIVSCKVESWITGKRWVSLPFSDHTEPLLEPGQELGEFTSALDVACREEGARYWELRPLRAVPEANGAAYAFHQVDLAPPLGTLFASLHTDSIQRKIRRAEREKLEYVEGRSAALLDDFYRLLLSTRQRHGLPPQPCAWFENLVECFGEDLQLRVARHQGRAIAAILTLRGPRTLVYKYGCSDAAAHAVGGMQLLMWRAIEDAKQQGLRTLDLGRSDLDNQGLITYKNRWGAESWTIRYLRGSLGRGGEAAVEAGSGWKSRIAGRVFAQLPGPVNVLAGRVFYRHMG